MVEAHEDAFARVITKLNETSEEARKSQDGNQEECKNSGRLYDEWAVLAITLILKEVSDPISKIRAFGDVLRTTFVVENEQINQT